MSGPWEKYQSTPAESADTGASEGPWSKYKAAPVPQESPSALASVGNTIKDRLLSAKAIPGGLGLMTPELRKGGQYAVNRLADVEQGAAAAIPKAAQFVTEGISQALPNGKGVWAKAANVVPWLPKPGADYMQAAAPIGSGEEGIVPEMAREIGGYLPYGALGEAKALPQAAGKAAQYFGKSILGQTLAGAAHGAANGEEGNRLPSTLLGAGLNFGGAALGNAAIKAFEKLRPSKVLRGTLSDEQLARNLEAAKGTETNLGDVIGNPNLKRTYENIIAEVPFSGANQAAERSADIASEKAGGFINRLLGENESGNVGAQLQNALKESKEVVRKEKNAKFNKLNDIADKEGYAVNSSNLSGTANDYLSAIKQDPRLALEVPSELITRLETYANPELQNNFKQTGILRGKLGEKSRQYAREGQDYEAGIYSGLKNALEKDWNEAIDSSARPDLKSMRQEANQYYKENYAPFKQPEVMKFIDKGGDSDTLLNSFVKTGGGNDRANLLEKLMSKLPEEKRGLVPYGYLSKAFDQETGKVNPLKFKNLYKNLGPNQKKVLFQSPELTKEADQIANLAAMNTGGATSMANPSTGQKALSALIKGGEGAALATAWASGGPLAAAAVGAAISGGANLAKRALTSEAKRTKLVEAMLKKEPKFKSSPAQRVATQTLAQAAMNTQQGNQ